MKNNTTQKITIECTRCSKKHTYNIDESILDPSKVLNFACLNVKRLPRLADMRIDFTKNVPQNKDEEKMRISHLYGEPDLENKLKRNNQINESKLWIIHDFDDFFEQIRGAYILGFFYPVATSCTTLAERLTNLFFYKMREMHHKSILNKNQQKYIYGRDGNWQSFNMNMTVLEAWGVLTNTQKQSFEKLLKIRHRAVHFQNAFEPETDSLEAVRTLHNVIDSYFNPLKRKDLFRVFEIAGEIWVKEEVRNTPFVKAFVAPCCRDFASKGGHNKSGDYDEKDAIIGEYSENDFIKQRIEYNKRPAHVNRKTNKSDYKKVNINGTPYTYRIV